jgi:rSAM/selenodomain-associated transferase 2
VFSVVIPTFNEADHIEHTIQVLLQNRNADLIDEIIIADGGSTDDTITRVAGQSVIFLSCKTKGRAGQMNEASAIARGEILYFLHADTIPPDDFIEQMLLARGAGFGSGCFRLKFDRAHWFLHANSWWTRFNINSVRFGDQSLFVMKKIFLDSGGFDKSLIVMEDQEIITRIRRLCRFKVMEGEVVTSARKYLENGVYKTQAIFALIFFMYQLGISQSRLVTTYQRLIRHSKL